MTVSLEPRGGDGDRLDVVVRARLRDELDGAAVDARPGTQVLPDPPPRGLRGRVGPGGLVGLVGVPRRSLPTLASDPYELGFAVAVPGFLPVALQGVLAPQAAFPATFAALDLGDADLHRDPVVLAGRVTRRVTAPPPPHIVGVNGARVRLTGMWLTRPGAIAPPPAQAPLIVGIDPPLYAARPAATGRVRRVVATPVPAQAKRLLQDAPAGTRTLRLSDRVGLLAPPPPSQASVLGIADELVEVAAIAGASDPAEPATITLAHGLAGGRRAGVQVVPHTIGSPGTYRALASAAQAGDVSLLPLALGGLTVPAWAQVNAGGTPHEYHRLLPYDVLTGTDGRWRFPPLGRVAQVTVRVTEGTASRSVTLTPTYERGHDAVDVELP